MQGPLEALRRRGWNTQKASFSFRLVIALSPDTVDYCHSYELFNRWWHGHVLATQRPSLFILMLVWLGSLPLFCALGPEHVGAGQMGGRRPGVGSCSPEMLGSNKPPPPPTIFLEIRTYSHSWRKLNNFPEDNDCLKGLFCKEARTNV